MSSTYGDKIKISVFGESHGNGIGVVIDGLPAGVKIDMDSVMTQMSRRAPGKDRTATPRKESDLPKVLSGMLGDTLTGAPLCAVIENTNTRSGDYGNLLSCPRPGHSDYTAFVKYNGANDIRGGGHFSGRITAPIVFAGSICRQILAQKGIKIAAHINSIGNVCDEPFNPVSIDDALIDFAGSGIRVFRQVDIDKTLIVSQIQVGLGTIISNKNLAVLVRAHGTRVYIYIRVKFLNSYPIATAFQKTS